MYLLISTYFGIGMILCILMLVAIYYRGYKRYFNDDSHIYSLKYRLNNQLNEEYGYAIGMIIMWPIFLIIIPGHFIIKFLQNIHLIENFNEWIYVKLEAHHKKKHAEDYL
jgi:hypothetical protein